MYYYFNTYQQAVDFTAANGGEVLGWPYSPRGTNLFIVFKRMEYK